MGNITTEVLVIGGGATGTGVVRDLAMRGFQSILVEKGDLTHGTTGRYHGLLHSGGRYVVKDPFAAAECYSENRILRHIMPFCIEDTGGFFVRTPQDDPSYLEKFVQGCHSTGIPYEDVPVEQMLREEPLLNPAITHCLRVPDGSADSFMATEANAESARQSGATILNYHKVAELVREGDKVVGVRCHDLVDDEEIFIAADLVVNATGAWVGKIAETAGVNVSIIPGKGTMLAINQRIVHTVINRCKMPSDGDILVPAHTVSVIGTTDIPVPDPDEFAIEPWEVRLLLDEGEILVPGLKDMRILRAWAGVRPLYEETGVVDNRDVTRAFVLLDHEARDGIAGFITITGGKWTTYRKMAEVTVDLVCRKLGIQRDCRTHLESLPTHEKHGYHHLGARLERVEHERAYGQLVCECELATRQDVVRSITLGQAKTIDDVRRDVRLGMGPCQGGFCTYRVAGLLHDLRQMPVGSINVALREFLKERWKGLLPVLWGSQLRQERLNELIYLSILNIDHLPGPKETRLSPQLYASPQVKSRSVDFVEPAANLLSQARQDPQSIPPSQSNGEPVDRHIPDVLIIGAGLAGLITAWRAVENGLRVNVIAKGWGATHWHTGCVDLLGYRPGEADQPVGELYSALQDLIRQSPRHPYALAGLAEVAQALEYLKELCATSGYPLQGSLDRNWWLPSASGAIRPTCLAPDTMLAGDLKRKDPFLLVGFEQLSDFYPGLAASNLVAQGFAAEGILLDLPILRDRHFVYPAILAGMFESQELVDDLVKALKPRLNAGCRVGFPAVFGFEHSSLVQRELTDRLGCEVFEIPLLPPSIPGIRLHNILVKEIESKGGRIQDGMDCLKADTHNGLVKRVWSESAARMKASYARLYVLATGGILGGGFQAAPQGPVRELIFDLPMTTPPDHTEWFNRDFLSPLGHPVFQCGIKVNQQFQPVGRDGEPVFHNLFAAGNLFASVDSLPERSFDGVALVTAFRLGECLKDHLR
jgi:glycerol-3-phosphate dehydrogenase